MCIRDRVKAALFYPVAVLIVAVGIMILLMCFVVPKFKDVFAGMNMKMPWFTDFVMGISDLIKNNILATMGVMVVLVIAFLLFIKTKFGRHVWDKFQLKMPAIGPVISKVAISRFTRTLGTVSYTHLAHDAGRSHPRHRRRRRVIQFLCLIQCQICCS